MKMLLKPLHIWRHLQQSRIVQKYKNSEDQLRRYHPFFPVTFFPLRILQSIFQKGSSIRGQNLNENLEFLHLAPELSSSFVLGIFSFSKGALSNV